MNLDRVVALVCNRNYIDKAFKTIKDIRDVGKWEGTIVLVGGGDWTYEDIKDRPDCQNIVVESFPDLDTNSLMMYRIQHMCKEYYSTHFQKPFQNHKIYLFHPRMKKYKTIFYIDIGMMIYREIAPFWDLDVKDSIIAQSDAYPNNQGWNLSGQFAVNGDPVLGVNLAREFPNLIRDYFQTTTMIYDTSIISDKSWEELFSLLYRYPFSITNDQAIISLYFDEKKGWKKMNPKMYDYFVRDKDNDYIMTKTDKV